MSTRGSVAVRREDGGWEGIYNHSDSYPTALGREVFALLRAIPQGSRPEVMLRLLASDDWRSFREAGPAADRSERITSENVNPLTIDWVYVVDPFRHEIEVLASLEGGRHLSMGVFAIDGDGFDAESVQRRARALNR